MIAMTSPPPPGPPSVDPIASIYHAPSSRGRYEFERRFLLELCPSQGVNRLLLNVASAGGVKVGRIPLEGAAAFEAKMVDEDLNGQGTASISGCIFEPTKKLRGHVPCDGSYTPPAHNHFPEDELQSRAWRACAPSAKQRLAKEKRVMVVDGFAGGLAASSKLGRSGC